MIEVLKCKNIYKKIGNKQILNNISFAINEGEILGFIGPNGAGKTTTIKCLLNLQKIDSGTVELNGYNIQTNFEEAIEKVGAVIEEPDLYMYLTGYENLKSISKLYTTVTENKIKEVVKLVKLEDSINNKVSTYSLGMRQRLGIAQALINNPKLLILDEPTNGLDPEGIIEFRELIKKLAKEMNIAIMISSHNLSEIENCCNKVCIIKNGKILEITEINTLKEDTKINRYIFQVNDVNLIKNVSFEFDIIDNQHIIITSEKEMIPQIVNELVSKKFSIYTIIEEKETLEDSYIKKIGGITNEKTN